MTTPPAVRLAGKLRILREPALGDLQKILVAYNALTVCTKPKEQITHLKTLMRLLLGKSAPATWRIRTTEWQAFLLAIPQACGLEVVAEGKATQEPTDWAFLYAHLCANTGWEWDYVDQHITLSRLKGLSDYWTAHPPIDLLAAAYLGYEKKEQNSVRGFFMQCKARAMRAL